MMSNYDGIQIELKDNVNVQIAKKIKLIAKAASQTADVLDNLQAKLDNLGLNSQGLSLSKTFEQNSLSSLKFSQSLIKSQIASENLKAATARAEAAQLRLSKAKENSARQSLKNINAITDEEKAYQRLNNSMQKVLKRKIALYSTESDSAYIAKRFELDGLDVRNDVQTSKLHKQLQDIEKTVDRGKLTIGQYNNALRLLPAQFTDIATQLAGGQNPFLIMLQQGGQMRDMFGSFGNMFKGIAQTVSLSKLAFLGFSGALAFAGFQAYKGYEQSRELNKALIKTNGSLGITAETANEVAVSVGNMTKAFDVSRETMLALIKTGHVEMSSFKDVLKAVVLENKYFETSIEDALSKYKTVAENPYEAVLKLSKSHKSLNFEVLRNVEALVEQGEKGKAVAMVQKLIADESSKMAESVAKDLGLIDSFVIKVSEAYGKLKEEINGFGRDLTLDQQIEKIEKQLKSGLAVDNSNPFSHSAFQVNISKEQTAELQKQLDFLKKQKKEQEEAARRAKEELENNNLKNQQYDKLKKIKDSEKSQVDRLKSELEEYNKIQNRLIELSNSEAERNKLKAQSIEFNKIKNKQIKEALETEAKRNKVAKARFTINKSVFEQANKYGYSKLEEKHGLRKNLLSAVSMQESGGNARAVSHAGAKGLFQFMPGTAREYKIDPFNALQASEAAAKKLAGLLKMFNGSLEDALTAYNWGEGNLLKYKSGKIKKMPTEAANYAPQVIARMKWAGGGTGEISNDIRDSFDESYAKALEKQQQIAEEKVKILNLFSSEIKLLQSGEVLTQSRIKLEEIKNKLSQAGVELTEAETKELERQAGVYQELLLKKKEQDLSESYAKELATMRAKTIEERALLAVQERRKQLIQEGLPVDDIRFQKMLELEKKHLEAVRLQEIENELVFNRTLAYEELSLKLQKINELKNQGLLSEEQANLAAINANSGYNQELANAGGNQPFDIATAAMNGLSSVVENYRGATAEMSSAFGNFFTSVSDGFADVTARALIFGDSAKDSLRQVAFQGAYALTQELIKVGLRWLITQAIGNSIQKAASKRAESQAKKTGSAIAKSYTPAAVAASIATSGQASIVGISSYIASQVLGQAFTMGLGGKARGGYTGNGGKYEVKGFYHGGEYVFDKESTNRIGVSNLDALRSGKLGRSINFIENGQGSGNQINVVIQNFGTSKEFEVEQLSETEVRIIAKDEATKAVTGYSGQAIARDLHNSNSEVSKSLTANFNVSRNR